MSQTNHSLSPIRSIQIYDDGFVNGFTINYQNDDSERFGGDAKNITTLTVTDDDFISGITIWEETLNKHEAPTLAAMEITTVNGESICAGIQTGNAFTYHQPNHAISRISGDGSYSCLSNLAMIEYKFIESIKSEVAAKLAMVV